MKPNSFMLPLLFTWMVALKTEAQTMFGEAPDNRQTHSTLLNVHHPGGSGFHSYHHHGPFRNGVLYVHRQGKPVPSTLGIHHISSPYNQHSKLSHQKPRASEEMGKPANRSADASSSIDSPGRGHAVALSSIRFAPTDYLNAGEINGIAAKMPVDTIIYPLAKTIQKHYTPRQLPFYVRLPPEHPLRHIPVAMVVTPPVAHQYFRSSNWYLQNDRIPLEERTPSIPTPRPPPLPSSPPPAALLPPLYFPTHNYYTFVPAENQTNDHQPSVPALHPPYHFPYNNCYAPAPESDERTSLSLQSSEPFPLSSLHGYYSPSELQMQQNNARSEDNVDFSSRSFEQPPSYYFPKTGYQPYDPSKLQVLTKGEPRTLPYHHASYHKTISHIPLLIHEGHREGTDKHILIHHDEDDPNVHSDLASVLYDDLHLAHRGQSTYAHEVPSLHGHLSHDNLQLTHGGHTTYLHEEPSLHGHLSLNLGRNAPTYVVPNMPKTYNNGFYQPMLSSISNSWPASSSIPYGYGNPSHRAYSSRPHNDKHSIPISGINILNDEQPNKQEDIPYLLRRLRSFEGSEHKSSNELDDLATESDKSLTISLPLAISNMADNETSIKPQEKTAISGDLKSDFHSETPKLLDILQVLNPNEVNKRLILEKILSRKPSNEEENSHKTVPIISNGNRNFSQYFSESSALPQVEVGEEVQTKQLYQEIAENSFSELRDSSLQSAHHEPQKSIASLDTLWWKMGAKRSKRQISQMQINNTSPDSDSKSTASARSLEEEKNVGYVVGFLDPESYNYYFGSENTQNFASDQNYYHVSNYKQDIYDKTNHVLIPVYYRQRQTSSYIPVNSVPYTKSATSDSRNVKEDIANPNITENDGYWTYNKTARYNSFGTDSFPIYYEPIQHDSHDPALVPIPYHQFVENLMPHHFLSTYPSKSHFKTYPLHSYNNKMHNSPKRYQQTSGYYTDMSNYSEEPQMDARSFSNMDPANKHPIRHHHQPNRYNIHPNIHNNQGNSRPHDPNAHPIEHHTRPGRYYAYILQDPEFHTRPYHSFNGANINPIMNHQTNRYYAHEYPHEKHTDARTFHNSDDTEESPVIQHYSNQYYEHASGYPPRSTRLYDYSSEGYYHPSRLFSPAPAIPYDDTELIAHYRLGRYEYPYQPNGDIASYQVDTLHQHPSSTHHLRRYHEKIHGYSYQPTYHRNRFHPSRYHHSHRYQEHIHGNDYHLREATPNSKISETNKHPQMRSDEEETDKYPKEIQSGINFGANTELSPNYPNKYYANGVPKTQIALVSFFTTDKQNPYPMRLHRLDPYGPAYHPSQYMSPNWEGRYKTDGYFSKMET